MSKTFFITGINGQDGAFLAKKALEDGYKVFGLQRPIPTYRDRQITFRLKELQIFDHIEFKVVDLRDSQKVTDIFKNYKPDYFAHLGSQSSVKKSFEDEKLTKESNHLISENIIFSIEKFSKDTIFFFPSSATIYEGYSDTTVNEETIPKPKTNYAKSKYYIQKSITEKVLNFDLQFNTGIMFSHESEYRRSNFFTKKIVEFLVEYKKSNNIKLDVGDISIKRDIGYAEEYVDAIYLMMHKNKRQEYIVSSNTLNKLSDFIESCLNLLEIDFLVDDSDGEINYIDKKNNFNFIFSNSKEFRRYDLKGVKGDNTKISNELGWAPKYNLDEISRKMIDYEIKK